MDEDEEDKLQKNKDLIKSEDSMKNVLKMFGGKKQKKSLSLFIKVGIKGKVFGRFRSIEPLEIRFSLLVCENFSILDSEWPGFNVKWWVKLRWVMDLFSI